VVILANQHTNKFVDKRAATIDGLGHIMDKRSNGFKNGDEKNGIRISSANSTMNFLQ
jgi:hypothetical protein